jgi:hypothetical protein
MQKKKEKLNIDKLLNIRSCNPCYVSINCNVKTLALFFVEILFFLLHSANVGGRAENNLWLSVHKPPKDGPLMAETCSKT